MRSPADHAPVPPPVSAAVKSILVLQFRTFGDVVLSVPLLDNLRQHYPGARLAVLAVPANEALLKLRPEVEFIAYRRRRRGSRNPLRAFGGWFGAVLLMLTRRVDLLIDISDSRTGASLAALSRAQVRVGFRFAKRGPARAFTHDADCWTQDSHYVDRYLSPLHALGLPVRIRTPHLRAAGAIQDRVTRLLAEQGLQPQGYAVVHVGARVASRQWPPERFAVVIDAMAARHGLRTVLIGGHEDKSAADRVRGLCQAAPLDRVAALSPEELVAAMTHARVFIGNDSGPMHLAAASGAPVVALFGMQSPALWGPLAEHHVVVRPPMPCSCPFPDVCRPPDPQATLCVQRISVDEVMRAVAAVMGHSP